MNKIFPLLVAVFMFSINSYAQVTLNNVTGISPMCSWNADGQIIAVASGGVQPYTYTLQPSIGFQVTPGIFVGLPASSYTVVVQDAANTTASSVVNLFPPPPLTLNIQNITPPSCVPGCDGSADLFAVGGVPNYTYSVTPSASIIGNTITNLCSGSTYTVVATDMNACTQTTTLTFAPTAPPVVTSTVIHDSCGISCAGQILLNISITNPPYTITSTGGTVSNNAITNLCGSTTYTLVVTDAAGCTISQVHSIMSTSAALSGVTASTTAYDASCNLASDGGIDLSASPSTGLTYNWSNGATTQDVYNIPNGNYSVTLSNANGDCMILQDNVGVLGTSCGNISGYVYHENVSNCIFDSGDTYLANRMIQLSTGDLALTDPTGFYQFNNVPFGTHTLTQLPSAPYLQNSCTQPSTVTLSASNTVSANNNFKDSIQLNMDEYVYLIGTRYVPGINPTWTGAWIKIETVNPSQYAIQNKVTLLLNDSLDFASASITPSSIVSTPNGDSLTWFVTVPPFSTWATNPSNEILVYINTPTNLSMGSLLTSCATVTPLNITDMNMANNQACITKVVATSFDPNDKSVQPEGYGAPGYISLQDQLLDYQIRFQNTGTAPAQNIYIMDTLSSKLDIESLEIIGYSHPYAIEIIDSHILKFKFNNIMLPDSGTNQQASNGFIIYRIKQENTNQPGDVIQNTASIYFDYNSPIVTNTTTNTIASPVSLQSLDLHQQLSVYPNPAQHTMYVIVPAHETADIIMYDALGQKVLTQAHKPWDQAKSVLLDVSSLAKGIYSIRCGQFQTKITIN